MRTDRIKIPRWFDRHLHLRKGKMLRDILPCTLKQRPTGAVIIGNLEPPDETSTIEKTLAYRRQEIDPALPPGSDFKPRMTCYLTDDITPDEVDRGFDEGVWCAVKLFMADQKGEGGSTNSQRSVRNLLGRYPVFERMQKKRIPLLGHWEAVEEGVDEFDREIVSIDRDLKPILKSFPGLIVVVEHVTDGRTADFVAEVDHEIYATVTYHHLVTNRNAMFRGGMNPINYCRPVPKREEHRFKVRLYVTSGNRRFGAGTDSAAHPEAAKMRYRKNAAGIFTAVEAVEGYTTVFDEDNAMEHLGPFLSENFVDIYGMGVSQEMMTLERGTTQIPEKVGDVWVFNGGGTLPWRLV